MKFTEEQLAKIKAAKTAEELIALAKAEGIEATEEQIKAQFDAMHKEGELADDELDNVAGGCGGGDDNVGDIIGHRVKIKPGCQNYSGRTGKVITMDCTISQGTGSGGRNRTHWYVIMEDNGEGQIFPHDKLELLD